MPIKDQVTVYLESCDGPTRDGVAKRKPAVDALPILGDDMVRTHAESAVNTLQQAWAADHISRDNLAELLAMIQYAVRAAAKQ